MPNDKRKMIKWQPFQALPEYQNEINKIVDKQNQKKMPILSDDQLEEFNNILNEAIYYNYDVTITYFKNNNENKIKGKIKKIENGRLYFLENNQSIPLKNIVNIVK